MDIDELYQNVPNFTEEEAEYIITENNNSKELSYEQPVNILPPKARDLVCVDVKDIKKINDICISAKKEKVTLSDLSLGVASLFIGAFFGAFISGVPYEFTFLSIFSYTICPVIGIIFGFEFFHCRKLNQIKVHDLAVKVQECIFEYIEEISNNEY